MKGVGGVSESSDSEVINLSNEQDFRLNNNKNFAVVKIEESNIESKEDKVDKITNKGQILEDLSTYFFMLGTSLVLIVILFA